MDSPYSLLSKYKEILPQTVTILVTTPGEDIKDSRNGWVKYVSVTILSNAGGCTSYYLLLEATAPFPHNGGKNSPYIHCRVERTTNM